MSAKYFIGTRPQTNSFHSIHKEGCPFLPDNGKRIYLGTFNSGNEALNEGQRHFFNSKCCLFCSREQISKSNIAELIQAFEPELVKINYCHAVKWQSTFLINSN